MFIIRVTGYYADVKNGCKTFHICVDDGSSTKLRRSFSCPNGTLFDQANKVCQWKDNVDCSNSHPFAPRQPIPVSPITSQRNEIRPTSIPFNTQIPSPINNVLGSTPPSFLLSGIGQPSPASGSLDAGRSIQEMRRNTDDNSMRSDSLLLTPPQIRPQLFRPSDQLDNHQKA